MQNRKSHIWIIIILLLYAGNLWAAKPQKPQLTKPEISGQNARPDTELDTELDEKTIRELFLNGYQHYTKKRYLQACQTLYQFINQRTPEETDYEWAEFFFGISLYKLGFTHAAADTLSHLIARKPNPKIVSYSLEILELISRDGVFDRELVINTALCDQSYSFVEGAIADFVHYHQGEYDWDHGLDDWGEEHFNKISQDTFYHNKYLFKRALREIFHDRIDSAISLLKRIITKLPDADPLKDDARKTLARLYYETGNFSDADFLYQQIEMNITEQSQNLLERAWTHYRMGNAERAMGLLYSFEAPSFANSFTPEFFILKTFIYKDVCHYKSAMNILEQFKTRYGQALETIYHRGRPQDNNALLLVVLHKPKVKRIWRFLNLLDREYAQCEKTEDKTLSSYLQELYTLKRAEYEHRLRLAVDEEYEEMADTMLRFEEESHLMEYEIGLDMYQRVYDYHYEEDKAEASQEKTEVQKKAIYQFQGEFWNDELDDYRVVLPSKCQNAEEWDIFFK